MDYLCLQATIEGQASHAHVHEIIEGLRGRGWDVDLHEPRYAIAGQRPGVMGRLVEFLVVQVRMLRALRTADVVYIRWHFGTIIAAVAALLMGRPVVQEVNGGYEDLYFAWPRARLLRPAIEAVQRWQLRRASAVIAVTSELAEWVRKERRGGDVTIIPNGANDRLFHPRATSRYDVQRPYVAFVGSMSPWQGISMILSAVREPSWPEEVHVVLAGSGGEESAVRAAATESDLIQYLGGIPYRAAPGLLAGSLAALSTSHPREIGSRGHATNGGSPLKLYEAMACGTPVIATDHPGQASLVGSTKCGILIRPDCPEELAGAVAWLWTHRDERDAMGARGRAAVESSHSWDARAFETDRLLRRLLEPGKSVATT